MQFFDTNILVYRQDASEPVKQKQAMHLINRAMACGEFTLSTQVLQEFYHTMLRKRWIAPEAALALMHSWADYEVVGSSSKMLFKAFELQQRFQLSVWDALIIQAALDAHCKTLYSEDLQHGMAIHGLTVINPFLESWASVAAQTAHEVHEPMGSYQASKKPPREKTIRLAKLKK